MRVADPLIPQIASEFRVPVGEAAVISMAFALSYGISQLIYGALGDRFGKYRLIALATLATAPMVASAGLVGSLTGLGIARLAAGATAGAIVPLAMAFIGDHVTYDQRQTMLARMLTGTILGTIAGQVFGGVLGELVGWRGVFLVLGALFLAIGSLLLVELRSGRVPTPVLSDAISPSAVIEAYALLLRRPWARVVLATVFIEGFLFYGGATYVGAYLHEQFRLDYAMIGLFLGAMGVGALLYTVSVRHLVNALGERGLSITGGTVVTAGFVGVAASGLSLMAPAILLLGLGLVMLHNTLQTNATQMAPGSRGLAVSTFANMLFLGQAAGVWLCGILIHEIGYAPVFVAMGVGLAILGVVFASLLRRRPAAT